METNVQYLKGVGPKLGELLDKRGLVTVGDLLQYYPRAYEDRRAARTISSLKPDETVSLKAQVVKVSAIPMGKSSRFCSKIHRAKFIADFSVCLTADILNALIRKKRSA